ncbi:hypothetical protein LDZ92_05345 [Bacteroides xylanisolvens]|nr:hypothetical protein [Bacteroides xylanisolvens]MCA4631521.1 hypothetical protein [Bacteroides xylanisolvens]MCA4640019.1 hypothetical protein [Bacteroides xylanisolvens]MCA4670394.1 hypothetical protein [Bacteroides xylanisolvens]MCA4693646.1 hypothetical protein [Bacteroides xylanisolvens]
MKTSKAASYLTLRGQCYLNHCSQAFKREEALYSRSKSGRLCRPNYFSKAFREFFGVYPPVYMKRESNEENTIQEPLERSKEDNLQKKMDLAVCK